MQQSEYRQMYSDVQYKTLAESVDVRVMRLRDAFFAKPSVLVGSNELRIFLEVLVEVTIIDAAEAARILAGDRL